MQQHKEIILEAARGELSLHSQGSILDFYKFFYQGEFGPGHLLNDKKKAKEFLKQELLEVDPKSNPQIQRVGITGDFYRVDLDFISQKYVSFKDYLRYFLKSAEMKKLPERDEWRSLWQQIVKLLQDELSIDISAGEQEYLKKALESDDMSIHHSEKYREFYRPHYRLISKDILIDTELGNLII